MSPSSFHVRPCDDEGARPQVIFCETQRIEKIKGLSVMLRQRIKENRSREGIPLETDEEAGIDYHALNFLVMDLPLSPRTNLGLIRLEDQSRHCSAFWRYQWIPESASILWSCLDRTGLETPSQDGMKAGRCWQQQISTELQQKSLYLINIAIVFGLDESLREEMDRELCRHIQTALWNSSLDVQLKTSVKFLNDTSREGCIYMTKSTISR
jgi:hypothetical protein